MADDTHFLSIHDINHIDKHKLVLAYFADIGWLEWCSRYIETLEFSHQNLSVIFVKYYKHETYKPVHKLLEEFPIQVRNNSINWKFWLLNLLQTDLESSAGAPWLEVGKELWLDFQNSLWGCKKCQLFLITVLVACRVGRSSSGIKTERSSSHSWPLIRTGIRQSSSQTSRNIN